MDTSEILINISENTALLFMVSTERKETMRLMVFSCGEEQKSLKPGKSTTLMNISLSPNLMRMIQLFKKKLPSIGSTLTRLVDTTATVSMDTTAVDTTAAAVDTTKH